MSIPTTLNQREWNKFQEVSVGETAVRVTSLEDRSIVQDMDTIADWTVLNVATTTLAASTTHKEGRYSVSFAKAADAAISLAGVSSVLASLNLTRYAGGKIKYWIYLSDLTDVASVRFTLGTSAAASAYWTTADTSLSVGWNEIILDVDSPTGVNGAGFITGDADYLSIYVQFDAAANTLAGVLLDAVTIYNPTKIELDSSDIQIGAVELKNAVTDDRALISDANTARAATNHVLSVQHLDSAGNVLMSTYDVATTSNKVTEQNPLYNHVLGDVPLVLVNIAANTTGHVYYDIDTYKHDSLQIITSGTTPTDTLTLTFEMTNLDDGTVQASCPYSDCSRELIGVASIVDVDAFGRSSFFIFLDTAIVGKYLRIKYVTSNTGGSDADLTIYPRKSY